MKHFILLTVAALGLTACNSKKITVEVENTQAIDRTLETVELAWGELAGLGLDSTEVVVLDGEGGEVPSQVIYRGADVPQGLIFQATVGAKKKASYTITKGERAEYPRQAYGRYVPERMDDFAWENNVMAFRIYGPALQATGEISNGLDVWLKRTPELVIDKWYTPGNNYHKDNGQGLDCYKVGRTLGAGAMAPYAGRKLWLADNYTQYRVLDNGPLRICFELSYAPFQVDTVEVTEKRIFTLDANTHFNRITEIYTGNFTQMPVAAGVVLRTGEKGISIGKVLDITPVTMVGYWEPVNMDNNEDNGVTGLGLVFSSEITVETRLGHLLASTTARAGEPLTYLAGAAWSRANMPTSKAWMEAIVAESKKFNNPLVITVK